MSDNLPIKEINKLADILKEKDLNEIEVESEGFVIRVRKDAGAIHVASTNGHAAPAAATANAPAPAKDPNLVEVKSPMVGTFYGAPSPGADPFVKVGSKINAGDTICIVEAMKLMNELPAEI